jgi:hypothetical protein
VHIYLGVRKGPSNHNYLHILPRFLGLPGALSDCLKEHKSERNTEKDELELVSALRGELKEDWNEDDRSIPDDRKLPDHVCEGLTGDFLIRARRSLSHTRYKGMLKLLAGENEF